MLTSAVLIVPALPMHVTIKMDHVTRAVTQVTMVNSALRVRVNYSFNMAVHWEDLLDLGSSASQSSDGNASAAFRIFVASFIQVCLFWASDLKCSRFFRLVSCSLSSDTRVRSFLRTTGSVVKGRTLNLLPCDVK